MGSVHASLLITLKWSLLKGFVKLGISSIRTVELGLLPLGECFPGVFCGLQDIHRRFRIRGP